MKWPDLIIVGATKCGTTALWYNLDKHPGISMATKGASVELAFWGSRQWARGFDWYKRKFTSEDKLCGEKTPDYYLNKKAFRLMKKNIPDVKLFLCVRNPVDRAYSNFQMHKKAKKVTTFSYNLFDRKYARAGKYFNHIQNNILPFFDREQLYICITERMKTNPTKEMKGVFEFLGVRDLNLPSQEIHGQLLLNRSRKEDIALSRNEKFYRVWSKHREQLKGSLRKQLLEYYHAHNEKLFDFLGYRIKEWEK